MRFSFFGACLFGDRGIGVESEPGSSEGGNGVDTLEKLSFSGAGDGLGPPGIPRGSIFAEEDSVLQLRGEFDQFVADMSLEDETGGTLVEEYHDDFLASQFVLIDRVFN